MKKMLIRRAPLAAALAFSLSWTASALDANDVSLLIRNRVGESVIMNIVREQGLASPLTTQDILRLNSEGASSELLELMTRSAPATRLAETAPLTTVSPTPPPVIYYQPAAPAYPVYSYPAPYYYYYPRPSPDFRYGLNFSFGGRGGHHHRRR